MRPPNCLSVCLSDCLPVGLTVWMPVCLAGWLLSRGRLCMCVVISGGSVRQPAGTRRAGPRAGPGRPGRQPHKQTHRQTDIERANPSASPDSQTHRQSRRLIESRASLTVCLWHPCIGECAKRVHACALTCSRTHRMLRCAIRQRKCTAPDGQTDRQTQTQSAR